MMAAIVVQMIALNTTCFLTGQGEFPEKSHSESWYERFYAMNNALHTVFLNILSKAKAKIVLVWQKWDPSHI